MNNLTMKLQEKTDYVGAAPSAVMMKTMGFLMKAVCLALEEMILNEQGLCSGQLKKVNYVKISSHCEH